MWNGTLPASNGASALVASTLVERAIDLPSAASSVAPLIEPALFTMTLLASWSPLAFRAKMPPSNALR